MYSFGLRLRWRRRHEWYRANNLIMPFFDRVIRMRCPRDELLLNGCVELRELENNDGWLGDISTWNSDYPEIVSVRSQAMNAARTCWLPNEYVAAVWQAFVVANPKIRIIEPPGQGDGKPFQAYSSNRLPVVRLDVDEGVPWKRVELFDGDRLIGASVEVLLHAG